MKIGSVVETVGNFDELRNLYGFPYPQIGDVLTVSDIYSHPNTKLQKKGVRLLYFKELPTLTGVCNKNKNGEPLFIELK